MITNNITGNKMFAHIDRVFGDKRPITADIFLNNYCNNNCPYCTYKRWEFDAGSRSMSYEDFVKYATRLKELGVLGFILTGGGEPTIAKDFEKITQWLEDNGFHYGINTNFNKLALIKPDYLKVSLDAYDEASYVSNRGVAKYEVVKDNIMQYADWKSTNSPNTVLGIQMLAKNMGDVYKFYDANKSLPVDYISIRPMESTGGSYYKNLVSSDAYADLLPENIVKAIKQLASLDKRVTCSFKWDLLATQEETCTAGWAQIAINEIGEVMYCCHKPYQIVGHIMDEDILEKKMKTMTDMSMCDIPCRMTAPNALVKKMTMTQNNVNFI